MIPQLSELPGFSWAKNLVLLPVKTTAIAAAISFGISSPLPPNNPAASVMAKTSCQQVALAVTAASSTSGEKVNVEKCPCGKTKDGGCIICPP